MAHALTVITGTPGTTIAAQCNGVDTGTDVESGDVNVPLQSVQNDLATISAGNVTITGNKTFSGQTTLSGGVYGNTTFNGDVHIAQTNTLAADGTGANIGGAWFTTGSSSIKIQGRSALKRLRVAMADGDKKVSVKNGTGVDYYGDRFTLPATTAAKRAITLDSTVNVPTDGETLSFFCQPVGLTIASGIAFEFKDDAASLIARVYWDVLNVSTQTGADNFWVVFEAVSGAWVLAENIGSTSDATNTHWVGVRLT